MVNRKKEIALKMNTRRMLDTLQTLVNTPSVVGYTEMIHPVLEKLAASAGLEVEYDKRHTAYIKLKGHDSSKTVCLSGHLDTIGMIVKSIDDNGWLSVRNLGGLNFHSLEGENVYVHTRFGKTYTGMVIHQSHSVHVFDDARTAERDENTMKIVLDEDVHTCEEVMALGIDHGDHISVEPRYMEMESGVIKSRHLDDKAACAIMLEAIFCLQENGIKPAYDTWFAFPILEEIGLGGAYIPEIIDEYVAVDIGLIGPGYHGDEKKVSICAADRTTPYDWDLTTKLIRLAKDSGIQSVTDIFYRYGSDASAGVRSGNNIVPALFGTPVLNSHGYERAHVEGIKQTFFLAMAYILDAPYSE
jgi:putative aminopeptidase FrvX